LSAEPEYVDPSVGEPLIGALLRMPWETVRGRMLEGLHARGFTDLHPAHLNVLQYPGPTGVRPSELAVRTRMSKQALNHLLGQMERLGYLERREDPAHRRARRVQLTCRGQDALHAIREIVREVEAGWAARLGGERFALLRELLIELQEEPAEPAG
jgi:DNA-binding MarR family transcriptional regulator